MPGRPVRVLTGLAAGLVAGWLLVACTSTGHPAATPVAPSPRLIKTSAKPAAPSHRSSTAPVPRSSALPAKPERHTVAPATPAGAGAARLPLSYPTGDATQVVTVTAASTASTVGTVQAWQKTSHGWQPRGGPIAAHLGSAGLAAHPSEGLSATPIGGFTLTQAFGSAGDPGTGLPYFQIGPADWWVSDVDSPLYNTHQRCLSCSFDTAHSENLYTAGYVYSYAVVIDYNRFLVTRGAGSAFFLHVTDGSATAGCVSIPQSDLVSIMRWLTPSAHPRILIGVT